MKTYLKAKMTIFHKNSLDFGLRLLCQTKIFTQYKFIETNFIAKFIVFGQVIHISEYNFREIIFYFKRQNR